MNDDNCERIPLALISVEADVIEYLAKALASLKTASMLSHSGTVENRCHDALDAIRAAMRAAGA